MKRVETYIRLRGGRLAMEEKGRFFDQLRSFPDGLYSLVAEFVYDNRTSPQNRYYWGVVVKAYVKGVLDEHSEVISRNQAHEALKLRFNAIELINKETGEIQTIAGSTRKMTTV